MQLIKISAESIIDAYTLIEMHTQLRDIITWYESPLSRTYTDQMWIMSL